MWFIKLTTTNMNGEQMFRITHTDVYWAKSTKTSKSHTKSLHIVKKKEHPNQQLCCI